MHNKINCSGVVLAMCSTASFADHPTVAFGAESAGPINTISADVMPAGVWGFGLRSEILDSEGFSSEELEGFAASSLEGVHSVDRITNTSLSASYGVTKALTLSARLPHIERENIREGELEAGVPEAHTHGDSSGVGDLLVFGQYRVMKRDAANVTLHFGVKAPTGETHDKDDDGVRFETEFQPGTGSWDFLLGGAVSKHVGKFGYHANVLYNKTTEGSQSTEIGDVFAYNAAVTYNLSQHDHATHGHDHHDDSAGHGLKWDVMLELNGERRSKNRISGDSEKHSGGNTLLVAPGVRVSFGKFSGFVSYGVPVVDDQNGEQTDLDTRVVAGISLAL